MCICTDIEFASGECRAESFKFVSMTEWHTDGLVQNCKNS